MRMGFGLVALLVVAAIIVLLQAQNAETVTKTNKEVRRELAPVTGRGPDDVPMDKSAEFEMRRDGFAATKVVAGGFFDQYFGLKQGDVITDAGETNFRGMDEGLALPLLWQMAQSKRELVVLRGGQQVKLKPK